MSNALQLTDTSIFETAGTAAAAVAAHVAEADPHSQYALESALGTMAAATETDYLLADGSRTGATSARQTFTSGIQSTNNTIIAGNTDLYLQLGNGNTVFRGVRATTMWADAVSAQWFQIGNNADYVAFTASSGTTIERYAIRAKFVQVTSSTTNDTPTARLDIQAGVSTQALLRLRSGTLPTTPNDGDISRGATGFTLYNIDSGTDAVISQIIANRQSSGTPAAGFGAGYAVQLESSAAANQSAGRLTWEWVTATHASRASRGKLSAYYTSTEQTAMTWGADSGGALLSFYDVTTPIARQTLATGVGASVDNVITALQNLGLVKQS